MDAILGGKALVNGTDIWKEYGVFLAEKRRGDRNNLKAILSPAKTKTHVAVDIREEDGEKYSAALDVKNQARDVKLCFARFGHHPSRFLQGGERLRAAHLPLAGRQAGEPLLRHFSGAEPDDLNDD